MSTRRFTGVTIVDSILFESIKDTKHPNCMQAIMKLRVNICGDKILSDVLWKALVLIAQDSDHPDCYSTAKWIWESAPAQYHACVLPILRKIAQDIHHTRMYQTILSLNKSEDQEDKAIRLLGLRMIAKDTHHSDFIRANDYLLTMEAGNDADKEIVRLRLYPIAQDISHPQYWEAIKVLLFEPSDVDTAAVTPILCVIGNDVNNPNFRSALKELWHFGNEDEKETVRQHIHGLVRKGGRNAFDWSSMLVDSSNEDDRILARQSLYIFADDLYNCNQKRAIRCLRESNDPENQRIGMELHLKYFSVDITPDANMRMSQFNREAIRAAMPSPLQDLSADPTDIVAKFA